MEMDTSIKKLQVLLQAIDAGTLTATAERTGYTQSGITHMMRALEEELGLPLLQRGRNGVETTSVCRELLPYMRALLAANERFCQEVSAIQGLDAGTILIGANASISMYWLPTIIERFEYEYPNIKIKLFGGESDHALELLKQGSVDVCFLSARPENTDWVHLCYDPYLVLLPAAHPLANGAAFPVEALTGQDFLRYGTIDSKDLAEVETLLAAREIQPNVKYVSNSDYAIASMVEHGLGISILPELILSGFPQRVVKQPLAPAVSRDLGIAVRSIQDAAPAVRRLIRCAKQTIEEGAVYLPGKGAYLFDRG